VAGVVAKFGPFISNDAMRNIIGQTKSGFNLREIMDNNKILLVNLSKGKMGELNSKLLGIIFVMKFQAAAMARADTPEDQRVDFSLYVDEFQNFATDSFESILSEARKYKLSLIMGNQFMTQLTDKIREAIIGNVGTVISGRIGVTDAELMVKKFQPVFDVDDLSKLPNFQSITSVMINNVPSAPFSMNWIPPMGQENSQLRDALVRLSSAKYGRPRAVVEKEIFERLGRANTKTQATSPKPTALRENKSFLDEWLSKRKQIGGAQPVPTQKASGALSPATPVTIPTPTSTASSGPNMQSLSSGQMGGLSRSPQDNPGTPVDIPTTPPVANVMPSSDTINKENLSIQERMQQELDSAQPKPSNNRLDLRDGNQDSDREISIKLR
ncbi:MAG: TraM recognition domain-containing protein, partial [Atopobium sp.]|nr:TraM recognition domain-containing protein [Atopobium sp.]